MTTERKKKNEANGKDKEKGLRPIRKQEFFGIEEAFRRAQQGAAQDPTKLYERALLQENQKQTAFLGDIAGNTSKKPMAEEIR